MTPKSLRRDSTDMPKQASKRQCWMASLGGCSGTLTKEHFVSESVWRILNGPGGGGVLYHSHATGKEKAVGLGSATISNVCKHHNEGTSALDAEAAKLYSAFFSHVNIPRDEMVIARGAPTESTVEIDGRLFERWTAKTFLNLSMHEKATAELKLPIVDLGNSQLAHFACGNSGSDPLSVRVVRRSFGGE